MSSTAAAAATLPPDVNRGNVYFGTIVGFLVPSLLIIMLRTWVRIKYTNLWWDDFLMIAAVPFLISNATLSIISIKHGIGRHIYYIPPLDVMEAVKMNTIAQPLNVWALFFVKSSIVFFLLRLKPGKKYVVILYCTLVLLILITIATFAVTMAQCQPLAKEWNPTLDGFCWSPNVFQVTAYVLSGVTIFTDVVYIVVPIIYLWSVQLKKSVKYGIWGVLSLGIVSMGCSIAAIPFLHSLAVSTDPTFEIVNLAAIKTGELNVAILVGCLPSLQPFFKRVGEVVTSHSSKLLANSWESRQASKQKLPDSEYEMLSGKTAVSSKKGGTLHGSQTTTSSRGYKNEYADPRTCTCGKCLVDCVEERVETSSRH